MKRAAPEETALDMETLSRVEVPSSHMTVFNIHLLYRLSRAKSPKSRGDSSACDGHLVTASRRLRYRP